MKKLSFRVTVKDVVCKLHHNDKIHRTIFDRYDDFGYVDKSGRFLVTNKEGITFHAGRVNGFGKTCSTFRTRNGKLVEIILDRISECPIDNVQ